MKTVDQIFKRIREGLKSSELSLHKLAAKADVNYYRLYRFHRGETELSIEDADKLYTMLTGASFLKIKR